MNTNLSNTKILKVFQLFGGELKNSSNIGISKDSLASLIEANEIEQLAPNHYRLIPYNASHQFLPYPYSSIGDPLPLKLQGFFGQACYNGLAKHLKLGKIQTIVELGSWLGKSTLFLAALLPENGKVYAVDHWKGSTEHQGYIWHNELKTLYKQFLSNVIHAKLVHKVIPMKMTTLEAAKSLDVKPDLVYVDASHQEEDVYQDLKHWYPLTKILCGDDFNWGKEMGYPVQKALRRFCKEEELSCETHQGLFWTITPSKN